ncbi:MAG TPA: esterase-like activity of phytase family protein, partial [Sphingomonas sp.]
DTEGIAATGDGFVIGEEYGPSLLHVTADGQVTARWVPQGSGAHFAHASYPVIEALPAIAARRQLNRGFEALAASRDGRSLFLAFQSPLAQPDEATHEAATHVRLWQMDAARGRVTGQWLYPLDAPGTFARDVALGTVERSDVKVSELVVIGDDRLLILERASATTKLYAVTLDPVLCVEDDHLDVMKRPTLEEQSARGDPLRTLAKTLIVSTDDLPEVDGDMEGILVLGPRTLLLVNDNDFGVEGVATAFWRVELDADLF